MVDATDKAIFGVLYCSTAITALICNSVLFYVFTKSAIYRKMSFYCIARQIIASDIVACLIHLYVGAPSTFYERNIYTSVAPLAWLFDAMMFGELAAHSGTVIFVILSAIHRLFIFAMPVAEKRLFHGKNLIIWIVLTWVYVAIETCGIELFGCQKLFSYKLYFFHWGCTPGTFSSEFFKVAVILSYAYPVIIFVLNCLVILIICCELNTLDSGGMKHRKREINMLVQNFCLCALIMSHVASFNIFGSISAANQQLSVHLTLLQNLISVSTCMLHPLTYLLFNQKVRCDVYSILLPWKTASLQGVSTVTVSLVPSRN